MEENEKNESQRQTSSGDSNVNNASKRAHSDSEDNLDLDIVNKMSKVGDMNENNTMGSERNNFGGFGEGGGATPTPSHIEERVNEMYVRLGGMEKKIDEINEVKKEKQELAELVEELLKRIKELETENVNLKKNYKENKESLTEQRNCWLQEKNQNKIEFKEIVKQQMKEQSQETIVKVMREKENIVRDLADKKKCIIILGMEEKHNTNWTERMKEEKDKVNKILHLVQEDEPEIGKQIEEMYRLGKYNTDKTRPIKIKFRSQTTAENILAKTGKLADSEQYKKVWIKREMNKEERELEKTLRQQAKEKNEKRSEKEKEEFYWRVKNMKLRQWTFAEKTKKSTENTMEIAEN